MDEVKLYSCKGCTFAKMSNGEQVGCHAERLEKMMERNEVVGLTQEEGEQWNTKTRFCTAYRDDDFFPDLSMKKRVKEMKNQTNMTFGIVLFDNFFGESRILDAIESLLEIKYKKELVTIIISTFGKNISKVFQHSNLVRDKFPYTYIVGNTHANKNLLETEAFGKCAHRNFFIKMNHDSLIFPDMLSIIDRDINTELEKNIFYESDLIGTSSVTGLYKSIATSSYYNYDDYDDMLNGLRLKSQESHMYKKICGITKNS